MEDDKMDVNDCSEDFERLFSALSDVFPDVTMDKVIRLREKNVCALPCAIGTKIYLVGNRYKHGKYGRYVNDGSFCWGDMEKYGKTIFLTQKEALAARDKMEAESCLR